MANLEGLPAEIKASVLQCLSDIPSLYSLIRASPVYHQFYTSQRRQILFSVLCNELTTKVFLEAQSIIKASRIERGENWLQDVENFMEEYNAQLALIDPPPPSPRTVELNDILTICKHQSAIRLITHDFHRSTLSTHPVTRKILSPLPLSRNETRRIFRAFYRYELFCTLFGDMRYKPSYRPDWMIEAGWELGNIFFPRFELWEVEEVACVRDYIFRVYAEINLECRSELLARFERKTGLDYWETSEGLLGRMRESYLDEYLDTTEILLAKGIHHLVQFLPSPFPSSTPTPSPSSSKQHTPLPPSLTLSPTASQKILLIEPYIPPSHFFAKGEFLSTALKSYFLTEEEYRSPAAALRLYSLRFWNELSSPDDPGNPGERRGPNEAWVWGLKGEKRRRRVMMGGVGNGGPVVDGLGGVIGVGGGGGGGDRNEFFRGWGWVMWDRGRLGELGLLEGDPDALGRHGPRAWVEGLWRDREI